MDDIISTTSTQSPFSRSPRSPSPSSDGGLQLEFYLVGPIIFIVIIVGLHIRGKMQEREEEAAEEALRQAQAAAGAAAVGSAPITIVVGYDATGEQQQQQHQQHQGSFSTVIQTIPVASAADGDTPAYFYTYEQQQAQFAGIADGFYGGSGGASAPPPAYGVDSALSTSVARAPPAFMPPPPIGYTMNAPAPVMNGR